MRRHLKKTKNPAQLVIKEIMNRMYGKTSLKPIETEIVVKTEKIFINMFVPTITMYNQVLRSVIGTTSNKIKRFLAFLIMSIAV